MNSCASCSFSCNSCSQKPPIYSYPVKPNFSSCHQIDPLIPAVSSTRPQFKKNNSKCISKKQPPIKPCMAKKIKNLPKANNPLNCANNSNLANDDCHPSDCACPQCEKCVGMQELNRENKCQSFSQDSDNCDTEMSNPRSERNMKNYLHDNPQLVDADFKKSSSCANLTDCLGPNNEVWILQCPKNFDPKTIMNTELENLQKDKSCKIELTTKCFNNKISLACLAPEKAAEYEAICDSVKMLRPMGKITISQKKINLPRKSSKTDDIKVPMPIKIEPQCDFDDCNEDIDVCQSQTPITSKKVKATINDQKFTIETTVTVENCGGDRKNRKSKQESCGECLPLVPPQPVVPSKKQKKNKKDDDEDLSWLDC